MEEPIKLVDNSLLHVLFFFIHLFLGVIFTLEWITNHPVFSVLLSMFTVASVGIQIGVVIWYVSQNSQDNTPLLAFLPMILFLLVTALEIMFQFSPPLIISQYLTIFATLASYPLFMYLAYPLQAPNYRNLLVVSLILLFILPPLQTVYVEIEGTTLFLAIALCFWFIVLLLGMGFLHLLNQQRRSST